MGTFDGSVGRCISVADVETGGFYVIWVTNGEVPR